MFTIHSLYLKFIFYYLEEVVDHKKLIFFLLLPFRSQYETNKRKVTFQNALGLAGVYLYVSGVFFLYIFYSMDFIVVIE